MTNRDERLSDEQLDALENVTRQKLAENPDNKTISAFLDVLAEVRAHRAALANAGDVGGLVEKWRSVAKADLPAGPLANIHAQGYDTALTQCADELEAALAAKPDAATSSATDAAEAWWKWWTELPLEQDTDDFVKATLAAAFATYALQRISETELAEGRYVSLDELKESVAQQRSVGEAVTAIQALTKAGYMVMISDVVGIGIDKPVDADDPLTEAETDRLMAVISAALAQEANDAIR